MLFSAHKTCVTKWLLALSSEMNSAWSNVGLHLPNPLKLNLKLAAPHQSPSLIAKLLYRMRLNKVNDFA